MFVSLKLLIEKEPSLTTYRVNSLCRGRFLKTQRVTLPPEWIQGVHWQFIDSRQPKCGRIFNLPLIQNYLQTRHDPRLHERAIADYLARLESSQQKGA